MDEQYILSKISQLMPDEHHIPQGVLYSKLKTAVQQDLSEALNNMLRNKSIGFSKTMNDLLINVNDKNGE